MLMLMLVMMTMIVMVVVVVDDDDYDNCSFPLETVIVINILNIVLLHPNSYIDNVCSMFQMRKPNLIEANWPS